MGCLNSTGVFQHWFGNIHLSGPCNRSCYFCIGQHMMALDGLDTLDAWPLPGFEEFVAKCQAHHVKDVYLTGSNTDAMLYLHARELRQALPGHMRLGFRTNGVSVSRLEQLLPFDMGSITVCSFNEAIYEKMMGRGAPPDIERIRALAHEAHVDLKVNIVLGPENRGDDLMRTLQRLKDYGITKVNVREPYGQPHIGDPFRGTAMPRIGTRLGSPVYGMRPMTITYWDVHYVEVESVNLYANGTVSEDYPITRGHAPEGTVLDQSKFKHGRHREQWVTLRKKSEGEALNTTGGR